MKTSLKFNLLQHLRRKQAEGGFTLIELLVVIIIIGILAAIALPSFLNQANRARETEAANYLGSLNRGQQAYRLESPVFSEDIARMDVGVESTTEFYTYGNAAGGGTAGDFVRPSGKEGVLVYMYAAPTDVALRGFVGGSFVGQGNDTGTIICRETATGTGDTNAPALNENDPAAGTDPTCGADSTGGATADEL